MANRFFVFIGLAAILAFLIWNLSALWRPDPLVKPNDKWWLIGIGVLGLVIFFASYRGQVLEAFWLR